MKRPALALLAGLIALPAFAQDSTAPSGTYEADVTHTNVLWSVSHFGLSTYIGRFNGISATLVLDVDKPEKSSLVAEIQTASVDANYPKADEDFDARIAEMFLGVKEHPKITFRSTAIELGDDNTAEVTGDLTLNGVTKPVTLEVQLNGMMAEHPMTRKPVLGFSAAGTIKRSDFGSKAMQGPIGDDVDITIEAEFAPKA